LLIISSSFIPVHVDSKSSTKGLTTVPSDEGHDVKHHSDNDDAYALDLIDVQKRRAIARWEEAYAKKYFEKDIYDCVLEKLKVGEVLPIYHTLCRDPSKRLFLPNTFVSHGKAESGRIKLSLEKVQA
jgi:hypothetical protein